MARLVPRRARVRTTTERRRRRGRLAALTLGAGVAIVLVFALVFSIAFGTSGVAQHATALHNADEALRAATVVRSQTGLATHLSILQRDFDFDAAEGISVATSEARLALGDLAESIDGLFIAAREADPALVTALADFHESAVTILETLDAGDFDAAQDIASTSLDVHFRELMSPVIARRDREAAAVASASALMGRVGDVARFLVAFLVPTAAILMYREMSRRQNQQRELEVRLDTEKALGKARDEFVANASHELRTPLTSIYGLAHLLEEDPAVGTSPSATEMVGLIISEANDLGRMVEDLLTTARLDAGALHYQFEEIQALHEVHEVIEPLRRAGVEVEVHAEAAVVRADRLRLRQVLRNLLSNARKYGGPNIRLSGRAHEGWYEMRVEDDGEGIPRELQEKLFQRFLHQGEAPLIVGSVGLGLSIVRALAEGMGGAVWYERSAGWTSFVVRVPLGRAGEAPEAAAEPDPTPMPEMAPATLDTGVRAGGDELPPPPPFEPPALHDSQPLRAPVATS